MLQIQSIELDKESGEELLPGFQSDFPYIATCAQLDRYASPNIPWHWHRAVELFYIESGSLEYTTPTQTQIFPAGSGGFVNSNVLHASKVLTPHIKTTQLLHIFDPSFLGGISGSRIDSKYILPVTANPALEMIPLSPDDSLQAEVLDIIRNAFALNPAEDGYELLLRNLLTEVWIKLARLVPKTKFAHQSGTEDQIKTMLIYIHNHYRRTISVDELAASVHTSKRVCFRLFQEQLHTTPVAYMRSFRLQKACQMLESTNLPVARIGEECGLGAPSYFGKIFREQFGLSPAQYRQKWHNRDSFSPD